MSLPASFLTRPITHRGLHDLAAGRAENSLKSFEASIGADYGIEMDLQLSRDGVAMVFHDYELSRLTAETGPVALRTAAELRQIPLSSDGGTIPTLSDVLRLVDGKVPLLIEIKDQDGIMGSNVGELEQATAQALEGYSGQVALMSFNPHSVAEFVKLLPSVPRGLVTSAYSAVDWPTIPTKRRDELRLIDDYERVGACFISHEAADLDRERVANLKRQGAKVLCWTIRSKTEEDHARRIVDNVTFEGYLA